MTDTALNTAAAGGWALTKVLVGQTSVAGHVDKKDVFASVLIEGNVLLAVDGEGPVLVDGSAHSAVAVCLRSEPGTGSQ